MISKRKRRNKGLTKLLSTSHVPQTKFTRGQVGGSIARDAEKLAKPFAL